MVKHFFKRANGKLSVSWAAWLLAGSSFIGLLLGFYREKLLLSFYYDTYPQAIDAFKVAFTVPDFMFYILVSGALSVTFLPVFNERLASGNKRSAWELSSSLINLMALATIVASALIIIFAGPIVNDLLIPHADEETRGLATSMMRVIAINPFLFAISSVLTSMQQAVGRFFFFALAPSIYSIGIIFGIFVFTGGINLFGWTIFEGGIMGVALGVVLGSLLQLLVACIGMRGMSFEYNFKVFWQNLGLKRVLRLLPARSLDQGIDYFNNLVEVHLAARFGAGAITAYQIASMLHMAPITLVGVAISTAAFPKMSERINTGRIDLFKVELQKLLRVIIWIALPIAAITFLGRGYIVSFVKLGGDHTMAQLLGLLALAILFRSIYHLSSRSFYAQQDTRTPLNISIIAVLLNIGLAVWFSTKLGLGIFGLAAAQSLAAMVEVLILFSIMSRRIRGLFDAKFMNGLFKMIVATTIMFVVTYFMISTFNLSAIITNSGVSIINILPPFMLIVAVSFAVYLAASSWLKLNEAGPVIAKIRQIIFRPVKPIQ